MPGTIEISSDPGKRLEVSIAQVTHAPTMFAYRLWYKQPNEADWTEFARGDTRQPPPYHHPTPRVLASDTRLMLKVALGGRKSAKYHLIVTFLQDGRICPNGVISEQGTTSGNGSAVMKREITLV